MDTYLLKHHFWGNFDTGVLNIYMAIFIWSLEKSPISIGIAFAIPIFIDILGDYYFSSISDQYSRKKLMIIGNIGSAFALMLLPLSDNINIIYLVLFFKYLFTKIYSSSLYPYEKEMVKSNLRDYFGSKSIKVSTSASLGGFILMFLLGFGVNMQILISICGFVELMSTYYLFLLKKSTNKSIKVKKIENNNESIKFFTVFYSIEAFAFALFQSRLIIYFLEIKGLKPDMLGLIFFIVYALPSILGGKIQKKFSSIPLKRLLLTGTIGQVILLSLLPNINSIKILILLWFLATLIEQISYIYSRSYYLGEINSNIGVNLSKVRIISTVFLLMGQGATTFLWENFGLKSSFYLSSLVLLINITFIILSKNDFHIKKLTEI